jgi:taurine--2-oxoglutarate transaminase
MNEGRALFTWSAQRDLEPLQIAGGEGAWFTDASGKRYLDLASTVVNANAGHSHPAILAAMRAQLSTLAVAGPSMSTAIRETVARRLARVTPEGLDRFLFTLGGADANEHAVKMARLITGRRKVLCRVRSYHGATFGALSFSHDPRSEPYLPALPDVVHVKDPYCHRCPWDTTPDVCDRPCAAAVEAGLREAGPETVAAVLMETVPGTNGGYFPPEDYYRRVREICDRHGVLLILDEVLTGFGRTGTWFAVEAYGIVPDMITMGKGITSGHAPLGAVAVHRKAAAWFDDHTLMTGTTHTAHPISLAAAAGNLDAFEQDGLIDRARALGEVMGARLRAIAGARADRVRDVRSRGLYGCLEMVDGVDTAKVKQAALQRGVHLLVRGHCLFVAPPLVIAREDLLHGLQVIQDMLAAT